MEPSYDFTDPCWYKPDGQIQTVKMRRQHSAPPSLSLSLSPPASAAASSCSTSTSSTSIALSPCTKPHAVRRSTAPTSLSADFDVDFVGHTKLARSRSKARRREGQIEEGLRVIKRKQLQLQQQQYPRPHRRAPPPPPPSRSSSNFTLPLSEPATPFAFSTPLQGNVYIAAASPYALSSSPSSSSSASSSLGSSPTGEGEEGELKSFFDFDLDMDEVDLLPKTKPASKSPKSNSPRGRRFLGLTRSKPSAEPSTTPYNPAGGIFLGYGLSSSAALPTPQAETLYLDLCAKPKQAAKRESWYHPRPRPRSTQPVLSPFLEVSATDDEKQPWTPAAAMESGMKSKSKSKLNVKRTTKCANGLKELCRAVMRRVFRV